MLDRKLLCFSKFGGQETLALQLGKIKQQLHEKNEHLTSGLGLQKHHNHS